MRISSICFYFVYLRVALANHRLIRKYLYCTKYLEIRNFLFEKYLIFWFLGIYKYGKYHLFLNIKYIYYFLFVRKVFYFSFIYFIYFIYYISSTRLFFSLNERKTDNWVDVVSGKFVFHLKEWRHLLVVDCSSRTKKNEPLSLTL